MIYQSCNESLLACQEFYVTCVSKVCYVWSQNNKQKVKE